MGIKLKHSAAAHSFYTALVFPCLAFFAFLLVHFLGSICSTHSAVRKWSEGKRKGRRESEYKVSLVPVQKLRRLDQNQ